MFDISTIITFALASFLLVIVPGPTVTVIIANSLRDGARAGLLNVAGTQAGLLPMILVVALGLETVLAFMADWFFVLKLLGAAYLVWLGWNLLKSDGSLADPNRIKKPKIGYFWQGFVVIWSNPKALFFFGAFIPQFVDPSGNPFLQTLVFGLIFMIIGAIFDSLYALGAGQTGHLLTQNRVRLVEVLGGSMLIGGGIWMALARR